MSEDVFTMSIARLAAAYRQGTLSPLEVTEAYLERITPGAVYRVVTAERARSQAQRAEAWFKEGIDQGPLQGVPIALKDLMDTEGEVTAAGSAVLAKNPPAVSDCPAAARLDQAGAVFLGKTNMTELAFSGLGINPHFGTPGNALDPDRIPGGSSSGSGVATASGLACAAIGSDTGGSVRIPASVNALVGLKTTDGTIPTEGVVPLSTTLDTLGPITKTVEDAWHVWRALCGEASAPFEAEPARQRTLLAPTTLLQDELEPEVARAFQACCEALEAKGVTIRHEEVPLIVATAAAYRRYGSFAGMESFALYEEMLERHGDLVDPRVSTRILQNRERRAADYIRLGLERKQIQSEFWQHYKDIDGVIAPTLPILPPRIADLASDEAYFRANAMCLRNTQVFNFLGTPAITVPFERTLEGLSIGVMIATRPHQEQLALSLGQVVERLSP